MTKASSETKFYHRVGFIKGAIFSCIFMSIIAYAAVLVKPVTFSAGGTIKSSEVNQNFDTIYAHINQNAGTIVELTSNFGPLTCTISSPPTYTMAFDNIIKDDGGFNPSTYEYTVTTPGYYDVSFKYKQVGAASINAFIFLNGSILTAASLDTQWGTVLRKKLATADVIKIGINCPDKKAGTVTFSTNGTFLYIKRL